MQEEEEAEKEEERAERAAVVVVAAVARTSADKRAGMMDVFAFRHRALRPQTRDTAFLLLSMTIEPRCWGGRG